MNVLFLSLSFSTENHVSSYEELLVEFRRNGHNVYVICANEKNSTERDGITFLNGLKVLRTRIGNITGDISILEKGISTLRIDKLFLKDYKKWFYDIKFDLVIYPTPPITLIKTINTVKKHCNAKTYLLLKDIFPQNAVDLGLISTKGPKRLIYKYFRRKEKKLYEISDYIGCMSPENCKYVIYNNKEVNPQKVEVCPNCIRIDEEIIDRKEQDDSIRNKYDIPKDAVIFIYGGNLGRPQGITFLIECLKKEKNNRGVYFIIVGDGSEKKKILDYIKEENPENLLLLNYLPKDEYQKITQQSDVGMIFLDYRFTIPNFPSRLLSYLRVALPVIIASDSSTDIGKIAVENKFGVWCESNNTEKFSICVERLVKENRKEMGLNGWVYLNKNYTVQKAYAIITSHLDLVK